MDDLDKRLIAALQQDGRVSTADLGRALAVSRTTIQSRLERLKRKGIILGFGVRLSPEYTEGAVRALVLIKLATKASGVDTAIKRIPEIRVLHSLSGDYDMFAIASAASVAALGAAVNRVRALPGVERTTSSVILFTRFDRGFL